MKERDKAAMTDAEVTELLGSSTKVQLATINPDGAPHLVTMFYVLYDGRIAFWTYGKSQKALNLARDPRLTCLVETGEEYFDLRGVSISGTATPFGDVAAIGKLIASQVIGVPPSTVDEYVAHAARKRVAFTVEPLAVASWDHRKLLG